MKLSHRIVFPIVVTVFASVSSYAATSAKAPIAEVGDELIDAMALVDRDFGSDDAPKPVIRPQPQVPDLRTFA